jgi:YD repeat-containing protein
VISIIGLETAKGQVPSAVSPTVIPPSPDAQSFIRYGEYPVDYSTGVPKIEIPLYEAKSGNLTVPISLSYHASGIPVNDISSVVGLGWRLNAGGVFTRTIKNKADETANGILTQGYRTESEIDNAPLSSLVYYNLERVSRGQVDSESDNYYYSTSDGLSAQFVYDNLGNIVPLSYSTDKIIKHPPITPNLTGSYNIEVIKDDGTSYFFDQQELALLDQVWYPSSWWLSKIISADKTDSITFEYEKYNTPSVDYFVSEAWTYGINGIPGLSSFTRSLTQPNTFPLLLKKINFNNGYVQFDYNNDRIDMRDNRLTAISVYDNTGTSLKSFQLAQSYFYSGFANNKFNYRLKLDKLNVFDGKGKFVNNYAFKYYDHTILPPYFNPYDVNPNACYAVDFWGYYNGQVNNLTWVPYLPSIEQNPNLDPMLPWPKVSANRVPDETYTKSCILTSVTYPTGGYSFFEYEPNVKAGGGVAGGLRIHRITSQADKNSIPIAKRYEYANNLLGTGRIMDAQEKYNYQQQVIEAGEASGMCYSLSQYRTVYTDNPIVPLAEHNGSSALYQIVDEYTEGGENGSLKTTYTYEAESDIVYTVQSPMYQDEYYIDRSWRRGQLVNTFDYKLVNGIYKPIKAINNWYSDYRINTIIAGTKVQERIQTPQTSACFLDVYPQSTPFNHLFYYFDVTLEVGIKKLIKQIISEYDDDGNAHTTIKNYSYESPNHLFPTKIDYLNSKSENIVTQQKYPHDFAGIAVYDAMISSNRISPVIQQLEFKDNTFLQSSKTNYKDWGNGVIAPETVETQQGNTAVTRLHYFAYDNNGNILTVAKENDTKMTYLWGYNQTYPVARLDNIAYSTISSNTLLVNYINQLQNYNDLTDPVVRNNLKTLNTNIQNNVPANAKVTTYTYKPLVGMTSQTDPNGVSTYYDYDDFGRLKLLKNNDGDIIKQVNYNYQEQPDYEFYFNTSIWNTFTRNNCPAGYEGNVGTYTIPYGRYSSIVSQQEANQEAQTDLTTNGQSYVNANTDCLLSSMVYLNYHNWTSMTFSIKYVNSSTGTSYNFTLNPNTNTSLSTIPKGTYNVTITPASGSELYDISVYNYSVFGITSLTKTGLSLDCSNCGHVEIDTH